MSRLSRNLGLKWHFLRGAAVDGSRLRVTADAAEGCPLYYHFDAGFQPLYVKAGADFERSYDSWRQSGRAAGTLAEYLDQARRGISFWDGQGWQDAGNPRPRP
jgi:hypothetical protein